MDYHAWLATFQTHEQAARSAFDCAEQLAGEIAQMRAELARLGAAPAAAKTSGTKG